MDIDERSRIIRRAEVAASAEGAMVAANNLLFDVRGKIGEEDFSPDLAVEITDIADRLGQIQGDLSNLAYSCTENGFGDELHRLANRGKDPEPVDEIVVVPGKFGFYDGWHASRGGLRAAAQTKEGAVSMIEQMEKARADAATEEVAAA